MNLNKTQKQQSEDAEFQKRLAKATYKTTNSEIGAKSSKIPEQQRKGINGKFTDHLIYSGMFKNASLNTTGDKDRWANGSKDWMEHLG